MIESCKQFNGRLVTNDLNLNKLATIQGIQVVNLNDVANALKPRFIPGEAVRIKIIKEGEGYNQGSGTSTMARWWSSKRAPKRSATKSTRS